MRRRNKLVANCDIAHMPDILERHFEGFPACLPVSSFIYKHTGTAGYNLISKFDSTSGCCCSSHV